ncbi:MAG: ATP-binding cassette domain-containing protein [Deltaproteobacteria bacterium]|nr:ATP-binding cassette domain-containing protein [Deltaproteobacteria bacterium]
MIHVESLTFRYPTGEFQLKIPEFTVSRGEKVAVIGPSGAGKTTLLNLIAGIVTPIEGAVNVDGIEVSELSDAQRRIFRISNIGFVFQDFELLDYLNVMDNILHPYRINSAMHLNKQVRMRAATLAEEMRIGDKLKRLSNDLSQGEKQRAAICRALLPLPKLILSDEATGNLDPTNKVRILELLFRSVEDHDATLLAVTHDHELLKHFDRMVDFQEFQT